LNHEAAFVLLSFSSVSFLASVIYRQQGATMSSFSISESRENFPALKLPQVYFDNAGGSQTLGTVIES
jgi:hypothetical protein